VFLTEDASSEPAIKVNARDVIEEEGNSDPDAVRAQEGTTGTSSNGRVPDYCTVSPLPVTSTLACCVDAPTMIASGK